MQKRESGEFLVSKDPSGRWAFSRLDQPQQVVVPPMPTGSGVRFVGGIHAERKGFVEQNGAGVYFGHVHTISPANGDKPFRVLYPVAKIERLYQ